MLSQHELQVVFQHALPGGRGVPALGVPALGCLLQGRPALGPALEGHLLEGCACSGGRGLLLRAVCILLECILV